MGGNDHQEKEKPSGVGLLRAGPSGVGRLRAGILEARSLGGSGPSAGVGRMRAGTLEARSLGGSPAAMSAVAVPCSNSCSVPKSIMIYLSVVFSSD